MAAGALLNAVWDLRGRVPVKPLWLVLAEMDSVELVEAVPPITSRTPSARRRVVDSA